MKKIVKLAFVAVFAVVAGYSVYANKKVNTMSDLVLANVEALADGESGGGTVSCYCKTNWFSSNVCTANGSGAYCGGDPCANHDGNCR
ncbi:MAG: NVEALA domain-containing protein [Bacteroides sp.]|jgi:hypothetical protein|nr:NVEALA domain-containing protein [Bacteroides sp.]